MPTPLVLPFLSIYSGSVDDKGRLSIPADYRHALSPDINGHLVFSLGNLNFLNAFPLDFFNSIWEKAGTDSVEFASLSSLERDILLLGESVYKSIDGQGRVLLPQNLLKQAGISRDIIFMGRRTHFTIWDAKSFQDHRKKLRLTTGEAWQRLIDQTQKEKS